MHWVLIDNGSLSDILFTSAYNKKNIVGQWMTPIHMPLHGFIGDTILLEGIVSLLVELGDAPQQ